MIHENDWSLTIPATVPGDQHIEGHYNPHVSDKQTMDEHLPIGNADTDEHPGIENAPADDHPGTDDPLTGMVEIRHATDSRTSQVRYNRLFGGPGMRQPASAWPWLLDLLQVRPGQRLLDVASGEAGMLPFARARGLFAVAVDLAVAALRTARSRDAGSCMLVADGERLPFADGSFERVLSFGSLEHYNDPARGAAELARVLAPEGLALVQVPNTFGLRWNLAYAWRHGEVCDDGQPIQRYGTRMQWQRLLEAGGLAVLRTVAYEDRTQLQTPRDWLLALAYPSRLLIPLSPCLPIDMASTFVFICRRAPFGIRR